nr:mitogen-activated protein kinase kinase kinase 15-like [Oncorhynchus nerka]
MGAGHNEPYSGVLDTVSASFKDTLLNDIRKARDKYQGEELAKELSRIKLRIDNTEVLTQDIVMNLLFSYRDIQDYDAMVKLVQTLEMLPTCDLATQPMIQFHYAFALNRRNSPGDREQALGVMLQVLRSCDHPAPDMFCLCGRIYKDIFLDSDCKDTKNRDNAIQCLSALLRSKWGPLKEATIIFYTRQILEGLRYLHENQIVHRDIKGDNVLVNTYSGVLKISDFGTSKRLAGVNPCTETFTGTLQYMAPEIIDKGPRGYGAPADIWSLGCTIIEMATGKPPFHELGEPQAAMFKVGMFKIHPEIPESLSLEAKSFILRCFEPDPNKRATASDLLKDIFVRHNVKGKKSKIAFKPSVWQDYIRSVSLPVQLQCEATGSSSSEPGSVSPDCDSKQDVFFQKNKRSGSENLLKPPSNNYLSVPDEGSVSEDRSSPASLEDRDGGLFLLKKDSERRAILYKVLNEDQDKVISNLLENHIQGSEELQLSVDHIKQIICILRDFIHSPERRVMATTISKLKLDLDFDSTSINQIQLVLFGFQDSVNKVLRNHHIKPHWMFAMDNIIRRAVQAAVTILIPELQTHFGPASESEGPDKEEEEEEEEAEFGPVLVTPPDDPAVTPEPVVTSAVSTLSSTLSSPPPPPRSQPLGAQLGRLKQETNRLLEELLHREREYQQVLKTTLQQRQHDLELVRVRYRPPDVPPPSIFQVPVDHEPDKQLTDWLKDQSADADTIDKFVMEEYTLSDVLNDVTKEDLRYLRLRGGVLCRIWRGIQRHRERERLTRDDSKDDG